MTSYDIHQILDKRMQRPMDRSCRPSGWSSSEDTLDPPNVEPKCGFKLFQYVWKTILLWID